MGAIQAFHHQQGVRGASVRPGQAAGRGSVRRRGLNVPTLPARSKTKNPLAVFARALAGSLVDKHRPSPLEAGGVDTATPVP